MSAGDIYVINGFYASMRAEYTEPGKSIYYFSVQWSASSLSWADFRARVLGATDPALALDGSLRKYVLENWESLGLASKPTIGQNGVHASASPFEALVERMNWLAASLDGSEKMVVFCSPHNPGGMVWSVEEIDDEPQSSRPSSRRSSVDQCRSTRCCHI